MVRMTKSAFLLAVALPLVLLAAPAAGSAPGKPGLKIADMQPLTLSGTNFKANERIVVRAEYGDQTYLRKTAASSTGRFTVTFAKIQVSRCGGPDLSVSATGSLGSRFAFTLHHHDCAST